MENAKTTVKFVASQAKSIHRSKCLRSKILKVLLSNKDNKDTYFVVFDGFISILYYSYYTTVWKTLKLL